MAEFATADAFYARVLSISVEPSPGLDGLARLEDTLTRASSAMNDVAAATREYRSRGADHVELWDEANIRVGDLLDDLATRLDAALRGLGDAADSEPGRFVCETYCNAAWAYHAALRDDAPADRARAQLHSYGRSFLEGCGMPVTPGPP